MASIVDKIGQIRQAIFGKEVRESIASGIEAINNEVESTTSRQEHLEDTFDQLLINAGNSNAEIVDARVDKTTGKSYGKVGDRLDEVSSHMAENKTQLDIHTDKIASLASGAPKAVSLANQMTDYTKNYVYTGSESGYISGNWYFWNGTNWISGGVYQSTAIGDRSVTTSKRTVLGEFGILNSQGIVNVDTVNKKIILPSGVKSISYRNQNISLSSSEVDIDISFSGSAGGWLFYDTSANSFITGGYWLANENCIALGIVWTNPINIYLSCTGYTINSKPAFYGNILDSISNNSITFAKRTVSGSFGILSCSKIIDVDLNNMKIHMPGGTQSVSYGTVNTSNISDLGSSAFDIDISFGGTGGGWLYYDTSSKQFITNPTSSGSYISALDSYILLGIIWYGTNPHMYLASTGYTINEQPATGTVQNSSYFTNRWVNKKITGLGDSITAGVGSTGGNTSWITYLPNLLGVKTPYNHGISGNSLSAMYDRLTNSSNSDYTSLNNDCTNSDVIILWGGINDWRYNVPIGTMADRSIGTIYGNAHLLMKELITRFPLKTIMCITPMNMSKYNDSTAPTVVYDAIKDSAVNGQGNTPLDVANVIKQVAQFYSIPCLDMYSLVGVYPSIQTGLTYDGLHPNDAGYARIANKVSAFLSNS